MKATFFERIGSYLIDLLIIYFIFSLIFLGFGNNPGEKTKMMLELEDKLLTSSITIEEYLEEYSDLFPDYQKENIFKIGLSVALTIAYYVVFQYMNKGQTIGKKLLNIQVVDKDTQKPVSILKGLLRTSIIQNILSGILGIILLYLLNKTSYFISYMTLLFIEISFALITIMFVLYKKDGRGLHDMMTNTIVIKTNK